MIKMRILFFIGYRQSVVPVMVHKLPQRHTGSVKLVVEMSVLKQVTRRGRGSKLHVISFVHVQWMQILLHRASFAAQLKAKVCLGFHPYFWPKWQNQTELNQDFFFS